ncbi:MAG: taurine dioxygenase [Parasphingorhabdus sp.]|jgi:taurine dioxygenase
MKITRLVGGLGAEISEVNLADEMPSPVVNKVKQSLWQSHLVIFRDQQLSPDAQITFGKHLGELKKHPLIGSLEGYPEIMMVIKEPQDEHNFAGAWHTDTSYQETPAMASLLYAIEVPEDLGDTLFCNMVAAYEALSPSMQSFLESLRAMHSFTGRSFAGREQDLGYGALAKGSGTLPSISQPVIRTHPQSGRRGIYVNPMFTESIIGLTSAESDTILTLLFEHCVKAEFCYRLRWQPGTVAIWDNLTTMHYPLNDYAGHRRIMRRIVIAGTERSGATVASN